MAEAYKCDRCGSFYTFDDPDSRPSVIKRYIVSGVCFISMKGDIHHEMDLCSKCANKIVRFLKNEVDISEE